jgi:Kelch motif
MRFAARAVFVILLLAGCAGEEPTPPTSASLAASPPASADESAPGATEPPIVAGWTVLADAPFARLEMATAVHDGRFWLAGGLSPLGEALVDVEIFDPATGEWTDGPSLPAAVHHAALVSSGELLLLIGGYLGSSFNRPTDLVLSLAPGEDAWREEAPLPDERAAGAAAHDGSRVIYGGGVGVAGVVGDVYALADGEWSRVGSLARPREHLAAASDGAGLVWMLGGRVGGLQGNLDTVELVSGDSIDEIGSLPTPRGGVAAFEHEGLACLTGGEAPDRAFTTVECIDADGTTRTLAELNQPHHGHGAGVVDGVAYVLLGGPEPTLSAGATVESLALDE